MHWYVGSFCGLTCRMERHRANVFLVNKKLRSSMRGRVEHTRLRAMPTQACTCVGAQQHARARRTHRCAWSFLGPNGRSSSHAPVMQAFWRRRPSLAFLRRRSWLRARWAAAGAAAHVFRRRWRRTRAPPHAGDASDQRPKAIFYAKKNMRWSRQWVPAWPDAFFLGGT